MINKFFFSTLLAAFILPGFNTNAQVTCDLKFGISKPNHSLDVSYKNLAIRNGTMGVSIEYGITYLFREKLAGILDVGYVGSPIKYDYSTETGIFGQDGKFYNESTQSKTICYRLGLKFYVSEKFSLIGSLGHWSKIGFGSSINNLQRNVLYSNDSVSTYNASVIFEPNLVFTIGTRYEIITNFGVYCNLAYTTAIDSEIGLSSVNTQGGIYYNFVNLADLRKSARR